MIYKKTSIVFLAAVGIGLSSFNLCDAQNINVKVNGEFVRFDGIGPQQVQGRVLVPLRGVLEKLGAYVDWVPNTRTVVASRGNMDLQLPIGGRYARVNGRDVPLDVPAMTIAGSTMVPLRFVGETMGAEVSWDAGTQTVLIQTPQVISAAAKADRDLDARDRDTTRRYRREAEPLEITSIRHNVRDAWLREGEPVTVTMRGTPGAEAFFTIPGVAQEVRMREVSTGIYEGTWTPPSSKALQIKDASIIGTLRQGDSVSPLVQAADTIRVDTVAPKIEDPLPAPGTRVAKRRLPISASFTDQNGSGIDTDRVRLTLDGRDVTADAVITDKFLTYAPPSLEPGKHAVVLSASDRAGNTSRNSWVFTVTPRENAIRTVRANSDRTLEPGDVLNVQVEGAPGSRANFSVGAIKDIPLVEQSGGLFVGSYTIRKGDDVASAPLTVTLVTPDGEKFTEVTERKVRVATGPPAAPVITFPGPADKPTNPLIVRGTGTANSSVLLKIEYTNRILGVLAVRGTAAEQEISVDSSGRWVSKPIDISSVLGGRGTEYTITAVAVTANNERSPISTFKFSGK